MKIVCLIGAPRDYTLQRLLESGLDIVMCLISDLDQADDRSKNIKDTCDKYCIPLKISGKNQEMKYLNPEYDIILSIGYSYIIDKEVIDSAKICINSHPTLLPHYKGNGTGNWALRNGDTFTGVTIHQLDAGIDTGDIILQKKIDLTMFDTPRSI